MGIDSSSLYPKGCLISPGFAGLRSQVGFFAKAGRQTIPPIVIRIFSGMAVILYHPRLPLSPLSPTPPRQTVFQ